MTVAQKLARDPLGNALALVVLAGMVFSVCFVSYHYFRTDARSLYMAELEYPRPASDRNRRSGLSQLRGGQ